MNSASTSVIASSSLLVPFPSCVTVGLSPYPPSCPQVQTLPRNYAYSASSVVTTGMSSEVYTTFTGVFNYIRLMRTHIEAFNSSALVSTSYDFETDLLSILVQITEIADHCMALGTYEGRYETSYSNVRFTLRAFMETVESRLLNKASVCLTFVVDAIYTFMEICISELSKWKAPHFGQDSVEIPRDQTMFSAPFNASEAESRILLSPMDVASGSLHKPSMLKRLRTLSTINLRRQKHSSEPSNGRKHHPLINSAVVRRMVGHLHLSLDQIPRHTMIGSEDHNRFRLPLGREPERTSESLQDRLRRAIQRCESRIRSSKRGMEVGLEQGRQSWPFVRSRTRSCF